MSDQTELVGLEVLPLEGCLSLLAANRVGRVGLIVEGSPRILPVNYHADDAGAIVFRTTQESILSGLAGRPAAFEIDGYDERQRSGWSVCVHGVGRDVTLADDRATRALMEHNAITWAPGIRDRWLMITPDEITGRRIPMSATASDFGWLPGVVS